MDIIVATPKSEMANAAREAENCIRDGGGYYFRRFNGHPCNLTVGEKIFYVENGFITGYATVQSCGWLNNGQVCQTTGKTYPAGWYAFMPAASWIWIKPIIMKGFQGYRRALIGLALQTPVGGWKDPKPKTN